MCQLTGYSKEKLLEMSPFDILNDQSKVTFQGRISQWLKGEKPDRFVEYIVKAKDGREIYASLDVTFTFDENGKPQGATVISHDITGRKQIEEALRVSEERQAFLLKLSDALRPLADPLEIQETAMRILGEHLGASRAYYWESDRDDLDYMTTGCGYSVDPIGMLPRFRVTEYSPAFLEAYRRAQTVAVDDAENDPRIDETRKAAFRALGPPAFVGVPLLKNGILAAVLSIHLPKPHKWTPKEISLLEEAAERTWAIVERAKAEEALRQSENMLRIILEGATDPVYLKDRVGKILICNSATAAVTGKTVEEMIGQDDYSHYSDSETARAIIENDRRIMDSDRAEVVEESVFLNGDTKIYLSTKTPWYDAQGNVKGIIGVARDITASKRTEEALKESEEKARALVMVLKKADQNKNVFLNMLSHELRNPLASIIMSLTLLDRVPPAGEQARKAREIAMRQGEQLTRLVDDLLDVTRITQNKIILKKENIELNQLVQKALEDYQEQFAEKEVALERKIGSDPIYLEADRARLIQVIGNLLHNAVKFTEKGDKTLVTVSMDQKTQEAVVTIMDTGLGIKTELLSDLFEPFIQIDSSLVRTQGGLGLGLAIVKGMVELHGGNVTGHSKGLGSGTKFTIRLPVISSDKEKQEDKRKGKTACSFKILVIDDIPDIAEILSSLLSYFGHKVLIAFSGHEGLAQAKEFMPDVVICDIGLPGMNGYEVAKSLRNDQELKDTFLIALSGFAQPENLEQSREAGFDRHLAKPVSLDTLEQVLAEISL